MAVLALRKAFRTAIAWWKRKYPILFQLRQGQLSVITAVNSLLTSKGCLHMRMCADVETDKTVSILFKISASALSFILKILQSSASIFL